MTHKIGSVDIGSNDAGYYIDIIGIEGVKIQFTHDQINALFFARVHSQALADAFADFCTMTFASGSVPSCFRQDLSKAEIQEVHEDLNCLKENFRRALSDLMLIFEH
jgi:hypothetical protein